VIPQDLKDLYKTVWEISQKSLINLARARAPFICQSQSLNIYMADPTFNKLTSAHFHAWQLGLKTGQYYLRSRPARDAIKFTLNVEAIKRTSDLGIFDHMNSKNQTQAEIDQQRRKKRKINEISKSDVSKASGKMSMQSSASISLSKLEIAEKENHNPAIQ
jgi:ribonucleoside-diphosphate reductase alpha chain